MQKRALKTLAPMFDVKHSQVSQALSQQSDLLTITPVKAKRRKVGNEIDGKAFAGKALVQIASPVKKGEVKQFQLLSATISRRLNFQTKLPQVQGMAIASLPSSSSSSSVFLFVRDEKLITTHEKDWKKGAIGRFEVCPASLPPQIAALGIDLCYQVRRIEITGFQECQPMELEYTNPKTIKQMKVGSMVNLEGFLNSIDHGQNNIGDYTRVKVCSPCCEPIVVFFSEKVEFERDFIRIIGCTLEQHAQWGLQVKTNLWTMYESLPLPPSYTQIQEEAPFALVKQVGDIEDLDTVIDFVQTTGLCARVIGNIIWTSFERVHGLRCPSHWWSLQYDPSSVESSDNIICKPKSPSEHHEIAVRNCIVDWRVQKAEIILLNSKKQLNCGQIWFKSSALEQILGKASDLNNLDDPQTAIAKVMQPQQLRALIEITKRQDQVCYEISSLAIVETKPPAAQDPEAEE